MEEQLERAWYEDDAFWEQMAPFIFNEKRITAAAGEVDNIIQRLELQAGARILDLACGPGRHALELARRGFQVTGVDRTTSYLERAREQAATEGLQVEFVRSDMRDFVRPDYFDAAINLFTAFGYFEPEEDRRVATNVYRSLKPGGGFLLDLVGKETLARNFVTHDWSERDGAFWLEERKIEDGWGKNTSRWVLLKDGHRHEFRFSLNLYSAAELSRLLEDCGFRSTRAFGDLAGAPYDHQARRLVMLARK